MSTKQILTLALVAITALLAAVLWQPHSAARSVDENGAVQATSSVAHQASEVEKSETRTVPVPAKPSPSPTPAWPQTNTQQLPDVHMQIIAPDGTSVFDVDLREGDDLCENIEQAKAEGHIRSLTVDDSYLATFGSRYVREINGYSNNWTVEVNGVGPKGCSLYDPRDGDSIVWEFGASGGGN